MNKILEENKIKISAGIVLTVLVFGAVVFMKNNSKAQEGEISPEEKIISVKTQKAYEFKSASGKIKYPATVVGDQEVKLVSGATGTAVFVNFNLGDRVQAGKLLVKIDDIGGELQREEDGFVNGQIQQLRNALEQAEENYDEAKDTYKDDKTEANESAKEIAELQRENAKIALRSAIDGRNVKAPIAGTIISKDISAGDSVLGGQLLATISKTEKIKIRFFADRENLENIKIGKKITIGDSGKETGAKIISVSSVADGATKRFLVEALPDNSQNFIIGTIVNVLVESNQKVGFEDSFILPLSALTIAQNETYFFIVEDGKAKKIKAEIVRVNGETAQVKAELSFDALIIVEGNKLAQEGERVEIK